MDSILTPWQIMLVVIAGWIHREQQKTIEFYQAQLKALIVTGRLKQSHRWAPQTGPVFG